MDILKKVKSKSIKRTIVDEFEIDGVPHRVVDYTSWIPNYKNRRELVFKVGDGNCKYIHSSIYLSPKQHFQPIFRMPQDIAFSWNQSFSAKNALVLGCAGCTFPRFYALKYPDSKIIGVELSEKLVDVARKHFLLDEIDKQFDLYCDDAFKFVEEYEFKEKQDIVFVDIFAYNQLPSNIFSEKFLKSLYDCTNENSVIMFNFLKEDYSGIISFAKNIHLPFDKKLVVCANERCYLLLIRSEDENKTADFENRLKETAELFDC